VKSRTGEEQILYLLIESLRKTGIKSLAEAFELFDKERRGSLSREDFRDVFKNMKLRLDDNEVDKFIDHFWRDNKAGIDYEAFLRIFQRYQLKLEDDEQRMKKGNAVAYRIPDDVIRLKKRIYEEMQKALSKKGMKIDAVFRTADRSKDGAIDMSELRRMFGEMQVKLTDMEMQNIFSSIDFDLSGKITYGEFLSDFNKTIQSDTATLLIQEKERFETQQRDNASMSRQYQAQGDNGGFSGISRQSPEMQMQTRIAILENREKQLNRKLETSMTILNHSNQSQVEIQKQYNELEKRYIELNEQFHLDKERIRTLEEDQRHSINREESRKLQLMNERLMTDLTETKAAMISYKNMNETIADQVKGLKMILERRKDENENLLNAVRELSS
jgi:Ca2+-binding EF-hand superfamily protein